MAVRGSRGRASNAVRFALERLILRGLGHRLLLASAIVLTVALASGALVAAFDPELSEPGDAVWWAFLRLTDPGYLGDDQGLARRTISTVVTVLGYVLFLGLLIAILTQWLNQLIARLESGVTPIALRDHVLVLGWTHRTPTIVYELLATRHRVDRFLARHGARVLRVVVLAERVDATLLAELRERLGFRWNDRQVMLRSGSPLHLDHLERVAFRDAAVLIIPGAAHGERRPEATDARTLKTLMAVSKHAATGGVAVPPLAVAEIFDGRNASAGQRAYAGDLELLAADEIIATLIAQSVRQKGLCGVFSELMTLNAGNTVYVRPPDAEIGTPFGDRAAFPRAIPLGIIRSSEGKPLLCPSPATVAEKGDLLVFLARRYDDCRRGEPRATSLPRSSAERLPSVQARHPRLLILGWSRKVPALLRELARFGNFEIDVVSSTPVEEREALLRRQATVVDGRIRQIEASYSVPGVLEGLEPQSYDNILLLASERMTDEEQADAMTVIAYLTLGGLLPQEKPRPEVFVELLDEENLFLFDGDRDDVIVSPLVVSFLLSQVALRRELGAIFRELSQPWGPQIVLRPAKEYLDTDRPVGFTELEHAAAARAEIGLGFQLAREGLLLNPDRDASWTLTESDQVVVLTSFGEPDEAR